MIELIMWSYELLNYSFKFTHIISIETMTIVSSTIDGLRDGYFCFSLVMYLHTHGPMGATRGPIACAQASRDRTGGGAEAKLWVRRWERVNKSHVRCAKIVEFETKRCFSYKKTQKCLRDQENALFEINIVKHGLSLVDCRWDTARTVGSESRPELESVGVGCFD